MFGPLGFYEILFILAIAFLLLGPRQMSVLSSNLGRTLREFYKATADVRRQVNAERAALEEEIRREQKPLVEALEEVKRLDSTVRGEVKNAESAWSRRNVLGQNETPPKVKPQPLREQPPAGAKGESDAGDDATTQSAAPRIRTPEGLAARGSLETEATQGRVATAAEERATTGASSAGEGPTGEGPKGDETPREEDETP